MRYLHLDEAALYWKCYGVELDYVMAPSHYRSVVICEVLHIITGHDLIYHSPFCYQNVWLQS